MTRRHWTPEEKIRIVLESLNTNIGVAELCRKYALTPTLFNYWRTRFIEGGDRRYPVRGETVGERSSKPRTSG